MKKKSSFLILLAIILICMPLSAADKAKKGTYTNPVWDMDTPDPTVIRTEDGLFYAYTTQGKGPDGKMNNIQVLKSTDLVHWTHLGDALPVKPRMANKTQNFWAPHVMYANEQYYLYFSAEPDSVYKTGKDLSLALFVATSKNPAGPFKVNEKPLIEGDGFVNIDPMSFHDPKSGKYYLFWGSGFEPLKVRELSNDLMSFEATSPTTELVKPFQKDYQFLVEGSWVIYKDGWYYLFYSGDNCCGERAHYAVMVARSKSVTGPYEVLKDKEEGDHPILALSEKWIAPGHNSIIQDDKGQYWIIYHAIDKNDRWTNPTIKKHDKRVMLIDKVSFKKGWPYIKGNKPTETIQEAPIISPKE